MKVSERLAALHIASLWCIAVAQPLFDVLRGSPEFFVAHDATPADLVGLVLLFCLAGPAIAALALWIVGRLAPGWRAGATGIMVGSLAAAVVLAALKPLGGWDPGLPLALAAGCGAAAGFAYIRLAPLCLFATFLSPALVVVPAAFLLTPGIAGLLAAADEESALDVAFGATPPVVIVIFDQLPLISLRELRRRGVRPRRTPGRNVGHADRRLCGRRSQRQPRRGVRQRLDTALDHDPREIYKADADAQHISDYLMRPVRAREQETAQQHRGAGGDILGRAQSADQLRADGATAGPAPAPARGCRPWTSSG